MIPIQTLWYPSSAWLLGATALDSPTIKILHHSGLVCPGYTPLSSLQKWLRAAMELDSPEFKSWVQLQHQLWVCYLI